MVEFLREAGFAIVLVLAFGAVAVGLSLWHAVHPGRRLVPLIVGAGSATLLSGLLGVATGSQATFRAVLALGDAERWLVLVGLRESLNNLVAALALLVLTTLLATVGAFRLAHGAGTGLVQRPAH